MAKGRKLTVSRSERLLGSYGYGYSGAQGFSGGDPDLGEDDVWSIVDDDATAMGDHAPPIYADDFSARNHRREERQVGGLSLAFDADVAGKTSSSRIVHQFRGNDGGAASSPRSGHQIAASAPVNVPDWSKILRVVSVESLHEFDGCADCIGGDDESLEEIVPPHEYLARVSAHSRNSAANSVFEGVGRTLKGRDLSRVRDAVWRQTGFDG